MNTQIPACLWFISGKRHGYNGERKRADEILFIDAGELGHLINRRTRVFSDEDIRKIADTYHQWRSKDGKYEDIPGFCHSTSIEKIRKLDYVLSPGRYVGLPEDEDDFDFSERFTALQAEFNEQLKEEAKLNKRVKKNLSRIKV